MSFIRRRWWRGGISSLAITAIVAGTLTASFSSAHATEEGSTDTRTTEVPPNSEAPGTGTPAGKTLDGGSSDAETPGDAPLESDGLPGDGAPRLFSTPASTFDLTNIVDQSLRTCIINRGNSQFSLGLAANATEAPEQILSITGLACNRNGVKSLAGIESFTALTSLEAFNNAISDLSPLAGLTELTTLNVTNNSAVSDLTPIAGLVKLTWLGIENLNVTDLTPLTGFNQLNALRANGNRITDASPLGARAPQMTDLRLNDQRPARFLTVTGEPFANPVRALDGSTVAPTDTTDYAGGEFTFAQPGFVDNSWSASLAYGAGRTATFSGALSFGASNPGTAIDLSLMDPGLRACIIDTLGLPAGSMTAPGVILTLTVLTCDSYGIASLDGIEQFTELERFFASDNLVSDLSPLAALSKLVKLTMRNNWLDDLSPLTGLTQLKELNLNTNSINDLRPIAQLNGLTKLELRFNSVTDLSPLSGLTELTLLNLAMNGGISDLTPLAGLSKLNWLSLEHQKVTDVTPLLGLSELRQLRLNNNQLADASQLAPIAAQLTDLRLNDQQITRATETGTPTANPLRALDGSTVAPTDTTDYANGEFTFAQAGRADRVWNQSIAYGQRTAVFSGTLQFLVSVPGDEVSLSQLDSGLRACIVDTVGLPAGSTAAPRAALEITTLRCRNAGIASIAGLEQFTQLQLLDLRLNRVSDLTPLAGLTSLGYLDLADNRIVDLSPLIGLQQLTTANLSRQKAAQPDTTVGAPVANPVVLPNGDAGHFNSSAYDAATKAFTFPEAGQRSDAWGEAVAIGGATATFSGILTRTVVDTAVAPAPEADDSGLVSGNKGCVTAVDKTVRRGQTVNLEIDCSHEGALVHGFIYSAPTSLGWAVVNGGVVQFSIPANAAIRTHKVAVYSSNGTLLGWASVNVTGTGSTGGVMIDSITGALSKTGGASLAGATALGMVLLLGGGLVLMRRRRAHGETAHGGATQN